MDSFLVRKLDSLLSSKLYSCLKSDIRKNALNLWTLILVLYYIIQGGGGYEVQHLGVYKVQQVRVYKVSLFFGFGKWVFIRSIFFYFDMVSLFFERTCLCFFFAEIRRYEVSVLKKILNMRIFRKYFAIRSHFCLIKRWKSTEKDKKTHMLFSRKCVAIRSHFFLGRESGSL